MKKFCLLALLPLCMAMNMDAKRSIGSEIDKGAEAVSDILKSPGFQDHAMELAATAVGITVGAVAGHALGKDFLSYATTKLPDTETNNLSPALAILGGSLYAARNGYADSVNSLLGKNSAGQNVVGNFTENTANAAVIGAVYALVKHVYASRFAPVAAAANPAAAAPATTK